MVCVSNDVFFAFFCSIQQEWSIINKRSLNIA